MVISEKLLFGSSLWVKLATLIGFRSLKNAFWQRNDFFNSLSAFSCKKKTVNLIEMHATLVFTTLGPNC